MESPFEIIDEECIDREDPSIAACTTCPAFSLLGIESKKIKFEATLDLGHVLQSD